jgi:hypothetical protein
MIGTYAATLLVVGCSLAIGQAAIALCGVRRWSWLAPAVGLALLCAVCWGTVRLPSDGVLSAILVVALTAAAAIYLRGRLEWERGDVWTGLAVGLLAVLAASLPFAAEGHFGILGTGFNPDMSQHLLTADRLAGGDGAELLRQGYPLGPHAVVVALGKGLGIGAVQGFDGLTVAVAVIACLTALAAFTELPRPHRILGALVVGLAYMVASYFAQGAFKETMQALFVLAFVLALREASGNPGWREAPLRFVPAALIAVGSAYTYSYPGPVWPAVAAAIWIGVGLVRDRTALPGPAPWRAAGLALLAFAVLVALEIGRMVEFHNFETFDPNGPGLGNLFGQVSPFEALGIWPSGDFRLSPGDGAVPALGYYAGAAFASILLLYGFVLCWRRRETAVVSGLVAVAVLYAIARAAGTPYTAAKAIEVAAPVAALVILLPLLRRPVGVLFALVAACCSVLALANAPVGPTHYWPQLTELRPLISDDPTLVLAPPKLLAEEHGERFCIDPDTPGNDLGLAEAAPPGVRFVIIGGLKSGVGATRADLPPTGPFKDMHLRKLAAPYALYETTRPPRGKSDCPLIAVRQARQGPPR